MKTERRHELHTNTLAHALAEGAERAKPYASQVMFGILALVLVILAVMFFRARGEASQATAWQAYFSANLETGTEEKTTQERLRAVADEYPGTPMADRAQLAVADESFRQGAQLISTDKETARKHLNAAASDYKIVQAQTSSDELKQLATYSLGQTYEMMGQLDKAVEQYQTVHGALAELAKARTEMLARPEVKDFYTWFATAEAKMPAFPGGPGEPGKAIPFDVNEPDSTPFGVLPKDIRDPVAPDASGDTKLPTLFPDEPGEKTPDSPEPGKPSTDEPATPAPSATEPRDAEPSSTTPDDATEPAKP